MHRTISDYKITKRKDGAIMSVYGTKAMLRTFTEKQRPRLRQNWRSKLKN